MKTLLLTILECFLLGIPFTIFYGLPLLLTGSVWAVGAILGGLLGGALASTAGVLPGSVLGAGALAGISSAVLGRYAWSLWLGAGWRYWKTIHQAGLDEPFASPPTFRLNSPSTWEIFLDIAAACSLAAFAACAGGWQGACIAGALTFGVWGAVWGFYLGSTQPRLVNRSTDLEAVCPANFCCPWGTIWHRNSIRWALGCSAGYALQAVLLGILPGLVCGQVFGVARSELGV
jgi:hypothetical protein